VVVAVKALACQLPCEQGVPLSRFSVSEIRAEIVSQGIAAISTTTLWRWLSEDAIRPWYHRSWIFPRDPDFALKAGRVLDLYHRQWEGVKLSPEDHVLSADEKTSIQARRRIHPVVAGGPGRTMRVEHEYRRQGALAYLAAMNVHTGQVFGRCSDRSTIVAFDSLVEQVMCKEPYRSARRVFWIMDNGSCHRGESSVSRLQSRWANIIPVHLPVHASWLNQVEIYFSIVQRKVLTPGNFDSLAELEQRLLAFQKRYARMARPFRWHFTRNDLARLLKTLDNDQYPMPDLAVAGS
jgi:hypothetical protein